MIPVTGKKMYRTLRDLSNPSSPKEKSVSKLCQLLQEHYKQQRLEVAETYRSHRCIQKENESISCYSAR